MRTAILTDSNSGISFELAKELNIYMLPMPVIIGNKTRWEGVDLFDEEFFGYLDELAEVSTSMPSPGDIIDTWDKIFDAGYDELVYIPMSSGLSSSCSTAAALAADYDKPVYVVDNHRISVAIKSSIREALDMIDKGRTGSDIKQYLEETAYENSIYLAVDTLEYFKRGGRISATGAALASVLNLKPVLKTHGDTFDVYAKMRGMKRAKSRIIEALHEEYETRYKDLGDDNIIIATAGSGLTPEESEAWRLRVQNEFPDFTVEYTPLSYSISCHTGKGACGGAVIIQKKF